ncbi:MAG TPA: metal ABC transporter permease [Acidimicrobiia bacterium]|nr:metal ABC transporter permease [Acidimicrobiia bacterium]
MSALAGLFGQPFFRLALVEAVLVGAVAGAVGVHVLLRRLPFFVVAVSHATFPGVVVGSLVGISLYAGGALAGGVVALLIVALGRLRAVDDSSAIGIVLAGSFAAGVLVLSAQPGASRDLSAYLVGSILTVTRADLVTTAVVGTLLLGLLAAFHKELVLGAFDPGGLTALGYPAAVLDTVVLLAVTVALVVCVPAVGTLLAVALLTVPALAARQWTDRIGPMTVLAAGFGAASGVVGLGLSAALDVAAGGAIALTATAAFGASALVRSVRTGRFSPGRGGPGPVPA